MTREEVYDKCVEVVDKIGDNLYVHRQMLPTEAIDAIIDCAVEEAVRRIKDMTFAKVDGRTGIPITKTKYVERSGKQE